MLFAPLGIVPFQILEENHYCREDMQMLQHPVSFEDTLGLVPFVGLSCRFRYRELVVRWKQFVLD